MIELDFGSVGFCVSCSQSLYFSLERAYENKNRGRFIDFKRKRVGFRKEKKTRSVYRLVFEEREKLESPEKTSRSKGENQEQTQSTCGVQYLCCHQA